MTPERPQPQKMRITLEVVGVTDRNGWEWGDGLARHLKSELNELDAEAFGPIAVECVDVEKLND